MLTDFGDAPSVPHPPVPLSRRLLASAVALAASTPVCGQTPPEAVLDPIVVTATRQSERSFDVPASVDLIGRDRIQRGEPMMNLSETLVSVPGIVANNRQNYAQDLQISSRGFGARSTFGVRGVRLYQDDIPITMPDGQGQTGSFMLFATDRIEVLRGPFATQYGNAAGGVITVFTESGTPDPELALSAGGGSYSTWTAGAKATGTARGVGYVVAASHFGTDGYRDHSAAQRTLGAAKLVFDASESTRITVLGTTQHQPNSLDPLGLTRAQWEANPRQADPVAYLFDTRKSIDQQQGGVTVERKLAADAVLRATGYGGRRTIQQFLAFTGIAPTSSGGVVDLDRDFGGATLRYAQRFAAAGGPLTLSLGAEYEYMKEHRTGYVNNFGMIGALRRNEDDTVSSSAAYAQIEWLFAPQWALTAGIRANEVRFKSEDQYVVTGNPDDSGSTNFSRPTLAAGLMYHATENLNLYVSYGQGFETPTFAELAYRPGGTGLNFDLQAAPSQALEIGLKAILAQRHRINLALYAVDTDDEIVVASAAGGRTIYKNGGKTRRRGVELGYAGDLGQGLTAQLAYTYLSAEFAHPITTGTPPVTIPAGNQLPGVPEQTFYCELAWTPPQLRWLNAAIEVQYSAKVYVNERNSDAAPAYTVANLRLEAQRQLGDWNLRGFVRLNNLGNVNYVGSVIVGDANGRYFEPAPERNWFAGITANVRF